MVYLICFKGASRDFFKAQFPQGANDMPKVKLTQSFLLSVKPDVSLKGMTPLSIGQEKRLNHECARRAIWFALSSPGIAVAENIVDEPELRSKCAASPRSSDSESAPVSVFPHARAVNEEPRRRSFASVEVNVSAPVSKAAVRMIMIESADSTMRFLSSTGSNGF